MSSARSGPGAWVKQGGEGRGFGVQVERLDLGLAAPPDALTAGVVPGAQLDRLAQLRRRQLAPAAWRRSRGSPPPAWAGRWRAPPAASRPTTSATQPAFRGPGPGARRCVRAGRRCRAAGARAAGGVRGRESHGRAPQRRRRLAALKHQLEGPLHVVSVGWMQPRCGGWISGRQIAVQAAGARRLLGGQARPQGRIWRRRRRQAVT